VRDAQEPAAVRHRPEQEVRHAARLEQRQVVALAPVLLGRVDVGQERGLHGMVDREHLRQERRDVQVPGQEGTPVQQQRPLVRAELLVLAVHPVDGATDRGLVLRALQAVRGVGDRLVGQADQVMLDQRAVLDRLPGHRATGGLLDHAVDAAEDRTGVVRPAGPDRLRRQHAADLRCGAGGAGEAGVLELVGETLAVREVAGRAGQVEVAAGDAHLQVVARAGLDLVQLVDDLVEAHQVHRSGAGDSGPDAGLDALPGQPLRRERQDRLRERPAGSAHHLRHRRRARPDRVVLTESRLGDLRDHAELAARVVDGELERHLLLRRSADARRPGVQAVGHVLGGGARVVQDTLGGALRLDDQPLRGDLVDGAELLDETLVELVAGTAAGTLDLRLHRDACRLATQALRLRGGLGLPGGGVLDTLLMVAAHVVELVHASLHVLDGDRGSAVLAVGARLERPDGSVTAAGAGHLERRARQTPRGG
jgi:hypothetical protein